jgi:F-type H+-transporting ATPase subunit epsilon
MADKLKVIIIKPEGILIDAEYDHVIVPGSEGDFGIEYDHTPVITKIRPGVLQLFSGNDRQKYAIHDGFVTVNENIIKIVCDVIEHESKIDKSRAQKAKERAEKRLKSNDEDIEIRRAEFALKRALTRLEISNI